MPDVFWEIAFVVLLAVGLVVAGWTDAFVYWGIG